MSEPEITLEQAAAMVNETPFPQAAVGDRVLQWGYWFVLTETGWVPSPEEPA